MDKEENDAKELIALTVRLPKKISEVLRKYSEHEGKKTSVFARDIIINHFDEGNNNILEFRQILEVFETKISRLLNENANALKNNFKNYMLNILENISTQNEEISKNIEQELGGEMSSIIDFLKNIDVASTKNYALVLSHISTISDFFKQGIKLDGFDFNYKEIIQNKFIDREHFIKDKVLPIKKNNIKNMQEEDTF